MIKVRVFEMNPQFLFTDSKSPVQSNHPWACESVDYIGIAFPIFSLMRMSLVFAKMKSLKFPTKRHIEQRSIQYYDEKRKNIRALEKFRRRMGIMKVSGVPKASRYGKVPSGKIMNEMSN